MLHTGSPSRSLLGLFLCLCLLLGHASGYEIEETQPQSGINYGDPGRGTDDAQEVTRDIPTLPPFLRPDWKPKKSSLPIIKKNGDLYYDLAGAKETHLTILRVRHSVIGITATNNTECPVQSLTLGVCFHLDKDLFAYCPLVDLTLKGKKWRCLQEGQLVQQQELSVDIENATCSDAWNNYNNEAFARAYGMQEGVQKLQEFGITSCWSEQCECNWYFHTNSYTMSIDCEGRELTDDSLVKMPTLPASHVTKIDFSRNNLSSMTTLLECLMPIHKDLKSLTLDYNQMTALPRLGDSFPLLIAISLANNAITKVDLEDFKTLTSREDLHLSLEGNPFPCDSHMYSFKNIIHQQCKRGLKFCGNYFQKLTCWREGDGKTVPLYMLSGEDQASDFDWWWVLNITLLTLNVIMVLLIADLAIILAHVRGHEERRPKMDYLVCFLRSVCCRLCSGDSRRAGKDE